MEIILPPVDDEGTDGVELQLSAPGGAMVVRSAAPMVVSDSSKVSVHGASEFISRTWLMVNDSPQGLVYWSPDGRRIGVKNPERMAAHVLPQYFSHASFASWVRALNANSFKKVSASQWEHPCFVRDAPELLKQVCRKPTPARRAAAAKREKHRQGGDESASTALVELKPSGPAASASAALLVSERRKLRRMEEQIKRMEQELHSMKHEAFMQRLDTVQTAQVLVSMLPAGRRGQHGGAAAVSGSGAPLLLQYTPPADAGSTAVPPDALAVRPMPLVSPGRELGELGCSELPQTPPIKKDLSVADLAGALNELSETEPEIDMTFSGADFADLVDLPSSPSPVRSHAPAAAFAPAAAAFPAAIGYPPAAAAAAAAAASKPWRPPPATGAKATTHQAPHAALHEALGGAPPVTAAVAPSATAGRPALSPEDLARLVDFYFSRLSVAAERALAVPPPVNKMAALHAEMPTSANTNAMLITA